MQFESPVQSPKESKTLPFVNVVDSREPSEVHSPKSPGQWLDTRIFDKKKRTPLIVNQKVEPLKNLRKEPSLAKGNQI